MFNLIHSLGRSFRYCNRRCLNNFNCFFVALMVNFRYIDTLALTDRCRFTIRLSARLPLLNVVYSRVVAKRTVVEYKSTFSMMYPPDGGPSLSTGSVGEKKQTRSPISYGRRTRIKRTPSRYLELAVPIKNANDTRRPVIVMKIALTSTPRNAKMMKKKMV